MTLSIRHKLLLTVLLAGLLLSSCQQDASYTSADATDTTAPGQNRIPQSAPTASLPIEYIDVGEVAINGSLPLMGKKAALFKVLGPPDSVVTPNMNDYCMPYYPDRALQCAYYRPGQRRSVRRHGRDIVPGFSAPAGNRTAESYPPPDAQHYSGKPGHRFSLRCKSAASARRLPSRQARGRDAANGQSPERLYLVAFLPPGAA